MVLGPLPLELPFTTKFTALNFLKQARFFLFGGEISSAGKKSSEIV